MSGGASIIAHNKPPYQTAVYAKKSERVKVLEVESTIGKLGLGTWRKEAIVH